jgi:uncharacterized protein YjdB
MALSRGTAFWIHRFCSLPVVQAAAKRESWSSARGGMVVLLAFVVATACETGVFDIDVGVTPASIELDIVDIDLISGGTAVIQAKVEDAKGKPVNVGPGGVRIEWSSSEDWIASVTPLGQATARVTGGAAGTAEITAAVHPTVAQAGLLALLQGSSNRGGIRASSTVNVRPADLIAVAGDGQTGTVGSTLSGELIVQAVDESGKGVPNVDIRFVARQHHGTLEPASVVTDAAGLARSRWTLGQAAGEMKAEAGAHNRFKLSPVEFTASALDGESQAASVEVTPSSATLNAIGDTVQLTAVVRDANGNQTSTGSVSWSSKNTSIATVDAAGRVVARKQGRASIVASVGSVTDSAVVDVEQLAASVTVSPASATLAKGSSHQFSATVKDANGATISEPSLTWTSSNPGVASVDAGGVVTAHEAGTATVTARSNNVSGTASVTIEATAAPPPPPGGLIPAFPGAEGWGATALNECRSLPLVVHKVTNTNDSGNGSLRDVLENRVRPDRFDVVVFTTGGLIRLESDIYRSGADCLYIAGQTAPGGGLSLVGSGLEFRNSSDVVVRHIRHRGADRNAFLHRGGTRMIYDHITSSWTVGRFLLRLDGGDGRQIEEGTVQNTLLYEPDESHSTVLGITGTPIENPAIRRVSVHRNVLLGPGHRMPSCQAREVSIANNVVYNWYTAASGSGDSSECDYVANYHKPGPATPSSFENRLPFQFVAGAGDTGSLLVADNRNEFNNFTPTSGIDPWEDPNREVGCRRAVDGSWCDDRGAPVPERFRRFTRLPTARIPVTVMTISDSRIEAILAGAGHSRRLTCDGSWASARDSVDAERIQWFRDGAGFSRRITAADMSVPVPARGTACADADNDGLPDEWENRFFGCPTCASPAAAGSGGYLVVEHYVNGTDPR